MTDEDDTVDLVHGRFQLTQEIGRGSSGRVCLAIDRLLGAEVAVKILDRSPSEDVLQRFAVEAEIGQALTHPHIVRVHGIERLADGTHAIVMEYVAGESVARRLESGWEPTLREALEILTAVASALEHAHSRGVVHRDLKPSNILLGHDGTVRLADFGVARANFASHTLTRTGEIVGTPAYMAPELLHGQPATVQSDIYSFGVLARELLGGQADGARQAARDSLPEVPLWLQRIIARCTERHPADRFRSMSEVMHALANPRHRHFVERIRSVARRTAITAALLMSATLLVTQLSDRALVTVAFPLYRLLKTSEVPFIDEPAVRLGNRVEVAVAAIHLGRLDLLDELYRRHLRSPLIESAVSPRLFCVAASGAHVEILRYLLPRVSSPDLLCRKSATELTPMAPLSLAVLHHRPENVTFLLDQDASFAHLPGSDPHPLAVLVVHGTRATCHAFFSHPRVQKNPSGAGLLMLDVLSQNSRSAPCMEEYAKAGAPLDAHDERGFTALHLAAARCEAGAVARLLSLGVPIEARTKRAETPLNLLCAQGARDDETWTVLRNAGADPNAANADGATLLMHAVIRHDAFLVERILRDREVKVDAQDFHGNTALVHAINTSGGDFTLIKLLLGAGADPSLENRDGETPLENVRRRGDGALRRVFDRYLVTDRRKVD